MPISHYSGNVDYWEWGYDRIFGDKPEEKEEDALVSEKEDDE